MSEPENYVKKEEPRVSIKQRRKKSIGGTLGTLFAENQSMLMLFAAIVAALAVILTGIIALHMPVVPVCLIVLLETGIACCLHDVPSWLHAIAVIVQIIAGVLTGATVFMVLCVVEYLVGILCLRYVRD